MLAEERRTRILAALDAAGTLTTESLAADLEVSEETIRRDLVRLDRQQQIRRVHGGAMATSPLRGEEAPFAQRADADAEAKRQIGELAAAQVSAGQTVILDVGTTVLAAARALSRDFRGTVLTCSLLAAAELAGRPGIEVLVAGGRVRGGDLALSNSLTIAFFEEIRADIALLGTGCVSADDGVTDFYLDEIATRRRIIANSETSYALADNSKLGRAAPYRVCGLDQLTGVITDQPPPPAVQTAITDTGGFLLYPTS